MTWPAGEPDAASPVSLCNLYAGQSPADDRVVIGGQTDEQACWSQTLTRRAARSLWFDLTRLLFPEKSDEVIAQVTTIPSLAVPDEDEQITQWVLVTQRPDGGCVISGWSGFPGWSICLTAHEVYRFWVALDLALFPTGW